MTMNKPTKYMPAGEFKTKCLRVMDQVAAVGDEVTITKRGKAVVRVVPAGREGTPFIGRLAGSATHVGDITSPIDVTWTAGAE